MFIRQGHTPIVLFYVSIWFELWFPASLLPLLSHLTLLGLHFVLQRAAFSLFGLVFLEDQNDPGVGTCQCNVFPARGCSLSREATTASTY